jgi:ubiquinone/menaquinone biosynthesis C-methylase UbiE
MTSESEAARIQREYQRRAEVIPAGFYDLDRPANYFAHCQLARRIISILNRHRLLPLEGRKIADIGCGTGNWLLEFLQWGADAEDLFGIDLNSARIDAARERIPGAVLAIGDASVLPLADSSMELVCQFTAFSSVLDDRMKQAMAAEMLRVVHPKGGILWYDLRVNNPANRAVRGIGTEEVRRLFPGCQIDVERATLAPPIARAVVPRSWLLASALERIPALCSHYLILIRKCA